MRLKSIKLAGFKSFVDPTTVSFPSNLAAVVGPNGCGKSNIIDAVRWVMGESSAKTLRGESMTDVIFNGSGNRQPVGQASIELLFDNSDGSVGGEYARFSEISIRRKVTRDGLSEYTLNGQKCRRRDITDIFLGTGLGPRSYAIIEQGMISRLIEAKPEELRVFIEEAAGISKYKERRRETENRMRRTKENLERLTDLREELERQLSHLQRQARAAERYSELKKEERLLKAQLQALQWRTLDADVTQREKVIREQEVRLEGVIAEHRAVDNEIEKHRDSHVTLQDTFNEVQGRYYSLGSDIARIEQTIQHQQERSRQLNADLSQTERSLEEAENHLRQDREQRERWQAELEEIIPELERLQQAESESAQALTAAEQTMQDWQQRWDEFNQGAADARQQAEVQQSRIQHLEQALSRLHERTERLEKEKAELSGAPEEREISELREQLAAAEEATERQQQAIETLLREIEQQREHTASLSGELDRGRNELQTMRGRRASLEALQQAALGRQGGAVNDWLAGQGLGANTRLGETLNVESGWETAVETVLGEHLQAVCVDGLDAVAGLLGQLDSGHLTLLEPGNTGAGGSAGTPLASKLRDSGRAGDLLHGIYAADDLNEALALRDRLGEGESVVTRDGLWVGRHWLRVARDRDEQAGVLERQQELKQLTEQLEAAEQRVEELEQQLERGRLELREKEQQREQHQRELQEAGRRHAELRSALSAREVKLEQFLARRQSIDGELGDAREQYQGEQRHLAEARQLLQSAIDQMERDAQARESLLAERDRARAVLDEARQRARHDKDSAHQLAMRHQSLRTQLDSMAQALTRVEAQVEQLNERRQSLRENLQTGAQPLDELQSELEQLLQKRLGVERELSAARGELEAVEHQLRDAEQRRHGIEQRTQEVRSELEKLRLESQGLVVRRSTVQEQLASGSYELEQLLAELPDDAREEHWREQLEQMERKIQRLGAINLAAIDEYKIQSERKQYLDAQNDDLEEALATLENAIRKIDKETRSRFRETFEKVNNGLQELFPRVFGGGHAYLEMTGDDLLDTGIAIMARPPGKRNSTIHLLSGGEKALTAIALVFSIFRLNPAPFCMLDEVDAPLDDANVSRYARMVKEMSDQVQFIFITHNKISMEVADQLLGVTMHEPGVSRLVSVDLDAAAEMAAS